MRKALWLILAGSLMAPGLALAEPGVAAEVYAPTVHKDQTELELRTGVLGGGSASGDWKAKLELSHAFTDWWRPGLVGEWEREGSNTDFSAVAVENVFDFVGTRDWPVHLGAYVEYEWAQEGADELELKALLQRARGPWSATLNLIGSREVGSGASSTWEFGYATEVSYALNHDVSLGIQGFGDAGTDEEFGDLDDHAHYWGPFAQFEIAEVANREIELQVGYLAGLGENEADGQFRVKLEYEISAEH